jgi:hypothetical protein
VYLRFCHLGHYLTEQGDYLGALIREVLYFVRSGCCWRAEQKGMHSRLLDGQDAWANVAHPSIHSFRCNVYEKTFFEPKVN